MFDFVIGLGQGGGRIAMAFKEGMKTPSAIMNLAGIDFARMPVNRYERLVFESGGTGRDPVFGERVVRERIGEIEEFLSVRKDYVNAETVVLCVGGGGGAGTGFMFPVLEVLLAAGKKVLLIYTMPEKREGLPTKPNALASLDRLVKDYIGKHKVSTLLIDNDFCIQKYGLGSDGYWNSVNAGVVTGLKRFFLLTQLERFGEFIDVSAGYKALDKNDVKRSLFANNGYVDLRSITLPERITEDGGLMRMLRESSLVFGSLDIRTTQSYVVSVGIPMEWKGYNWTTDFVEEVFAVVSKATRHAPYVIRTSYFNSRISEMQVHLLLSGMARSRGIDKMIAGTEKDQDRYDERSGVDRLNVKKVSKHSV